MFAFWRGCELFKSFRSGGSTETCKTAQEMEDVDLRACPSTVCIQEATCCLQDRTRSCCPVPGPRSRHVFFFVLFCWSDFFRARNLRLWLCNSFHVCVYLSCFHLCVRMCIGVGGGMVTALRFVGSHSSNWLAPTLPPDPTTTTALGHKWF